MRFFSITLKNDDLLSVIDDECCVRCSKRALCATESPLGFWAAKTRRHERTFWNGRYCKQ